MVQHRLAVKHVDSRTRELVLEAPVVAMGLWARQFPCTSVSLSVKWA